MLAALTDIMCDPIKFNEEDWIGYKDAVIKDLLAKLILIGKELVKKVILLKFCVKHIFAPRKIFIPIQTNNWR